MSRTPRRNFLKSLFAQPYPYLPYAVWGFVVLCFALNPLSPVRTGHLSDPDDYMRLNEVIAWLQGQGWHDLSVPRLSAGTHTVIHWSRLVDLPIALFMLPFIHSFGYQAAALISSMLVPLILLAAMLWLVCALAKNLVSPQRGNLASVLFLFAPMVMFNASPGRVDHHGYQILIAGFGLLCLERMVNEVKTWGFAVLAAIAFACGLWIGTEALPWLMIFTAILGIMAAWQGGEALKNAAVFGLSLTLATLVILPFALPASDYTSRALSWFSPADVIFAGLIALIFDIGGILGAQTKNRKLRLALMASLAFCAAAIFLRFVPDAMIGPFADYDSFNSGTALDNINEARPLWHALWIDRYNPLTYTRALSAFIHLLALPLAAIIACAYNIQHSRKRARMTWIMYGTFLLSAFLLTLFWQVRVGYFMQLFALAPLTWLLCAGCDEATLFRGRARYWAEVGIFMLFGPLPVLLIPTLFEPTHVYPDLLLFPASRTADNCPLQPAARYINERYKGRDITILAGMNEGPELLFLTPFKVIAANYNVAGNADVRDFFNARDDKTAQKIARKWHADVVLTCRNIAPFMAGMDNPNFGHSVFLKPGKDGKLHLSSGLSHPALLEKLVNNTAPAWLKPVEIPGDTSYLLYEFDTGIKAK
ncbi:MAG TPA: hypothetical protein VFR09_04190 [Alphaproteobacteria bacterium]|nr:hypothetical protein [Alphaproteobacteria bacterium]